MSKSLKTSHEGWAQPTASDAVNYQTSALRLQVESVGQLSMAEDSPSAQWDDGQRFRRTQVSVEDASSPRPSPGLTKMLVTALLLVTGRRDFGRFEFARYLLGFSNAQVRFCSGE